MPGHVRPPDKHVSTQVVLSNPMKTRQTCILLELYCHPFERQEIHLIKSIMLEIIFVDILKYNMFVQVWSFWILYMDAAAQTNYFLSFIRIIHNLSELETVVSKHAETRVFQLIYVDVPWTFSFLSIHTDHKHLQ